jgi:hypothetical protein
MGKGIEVSLFDGMADWMNVPLLFFEGTGNTLSPHNLSSEERNLLAVVLKPVVSLLFKLPKVSSALGNLKDISQGVLHLSFNIAKIALNGTNASKNAREGYIFSVLGPHTFGRLSRNWLALTSNEFETFHAVKAISNVLINLWRVVTIGQDIEKCLVRHEVEAWEHLFLLFKIFIKCLLAKFDFIKEVV